MNRHDKPLAPSDDIKVTELTKGIEHTRAEMSMTINALEHRLDPKELGEKARAEIDHIEERVKAVMKEGLDEAKVAVKEQLHETKELVQRGLIDARETVKKDIQSAITHTKQSVREATLGRVEAIATQAGDVMNNTRDTLIETVRQNPIPAALAGIGIAWLLMNRSSANRQRNVRYDANGFTNGGYSGNGQRGFGVGEALLGAQHSVGNAASHLAHQTGDVVHQVGSALGQAKTAVANAAQGATTAVRGGLVQGVDAVSHLVDAAGRTVNSTTDAAGNFIHNAADAAGNLAQQAQQTTGAIASGAMEQARRVERGLESTLESNPLALGAVALAIGAAVGYSLPRTEKENELMGEIRDRVVDGASHMAHDATRSLMHMAGDASTSVKEAIGASSANASK